MVHSSASDTRCARSYRSRIAVLRTTRQACLNRSSLSPSLSASSASETLRAPISLCHSHPPSHHLRPMLPRYSSRLCSPPGLAICLSSRHTPNYSTPMGIQGTMIPSPCRFTHPLQARCRRHRMLAIDLREFVSSSFPHPPLVWERTGGGFPSSTTRALCSARIASFNALLSLSAELTVMSAARARRRDEVNIAEAALDDLGAQIAHRRGVQGVPHQCSDLEIGVGLDEFSKRRA